MEEMDLRSDYRIMKGEGVRRGNSQRGVGVVINAIGGVGYHLVMWCLHRLVMTSSSINFDVGDVVRCRFRRG